VISVGDVKIHAVIGEFGRRHPRVMEALGFERYAVCGHDIGAMVALALACTHRRAVNHLAVLDAPLPGWS
jgi:pimeloyl-ACP methyl ester carboxylesterase